MDTTCTTEYMRLTLQDGCQKALDMPGLGEVWASLTRKNFENEVTVSIFMQQECQGPAYYGPIEVPLDVCYPVALYSVTVTVDNKRAEPELPSPKKRSIPDSS
eukprot:CAMPEP_0174258026 /NCGR_PEP_ID=MMETSP0439-20130205/7101_1 /TAXON_ID=0 /ORGANISM="Stereomyxa ramosa, Strain Chinc5" /LENGTH=102 /DNA_ID=CAMNT_0015341371 /DNA_START=55 /DNA_END=360 /DNA_ORIENTATION=+